MRRGRRGARTCDRLRVAHFFGVTCTRSRQVTFWRQTTLAPDQGGTDDFSVRGMANGYVTFRKKRCDKKSPLAHKPSSAHESSVDLGPPALGFGLDDVAKQLAPLLQATVRDSTALCPAANLPNALLSGCV